MSTLRSLIGIAAVVALVIGLNLMILEESLFAGRAMLAFASGLGLGLLWIVLHLVKAVSKRNVDTVYAINTVVGSLLFLAICITAYAFVKRTEISVDLTQEGRRELAPQTKLVLRTLTKEVNIHCLFMKSGEEQARYAQDKTRRFLERCQEYTDLLNVEFIDPQAHPEQAKLLSKLTEIKVGTIVFESGANQRELPLTTVNARLEERDFTNILINLSRETMPKVYFLDGHIKLMSGQPSRDIDDTDPVMGSSLFKLLLSRESYAVEKMVIPPERPFVPDDCSVLVINHYDQDLFPHEVRALNQFIDDGGRMLILNNPAMIEEQGIEVREQLRPWLKSRFGINIHSDLVASPLTNKLDQILLLSDFSRLGDYPMEVLAPDSFRGSYNLTHPITRTFDQQMILPFARSIHLEKELPVNVVGDILLRTTPDTWGETDLEGLRVGKSLKQDAGEIQGPNPVAVAVTMHSDEPQLDGSRSKDARLVVIGNADLAVNKHIQTRGNIDLILNSMAWLTESEDLIAIRPTGQVNQPLYLTTEEERAISWLASLGAVQLIVLAGIIAFLIRRRHQ